MSQKKKICIFSAQYLPSKGGVERYTYNLSKELGKKGYDITVVTSNVYKIERFKKEKNHRIIRLDCFNLLKGRYPIYKKNRNFFKTLRMLKKENFDYIIINTRFYLHSLLGAKFAKKNGIPCFVIEHGTSHLTVNNPFLDKIGAVYEHILTHFLKKYCDCFYGVSKMASGWLNHFKITSLGELYNFVDIDEIKKTYNSDSQSYREKLGIKNDITLIAFVGRLVKEKGILNLIDAVESSSREDIRLAVAGDGPLNKYISSLSLKKTFLLGEVEFSNVISLLSTSDVFCLPSEFEGMSTSLLEAGITKCFIISTDCGGAREIINGNNGIILKDNSIKSIKEQIDGIDKNSMYFKESTSNVYQNIYENFSLSKTALKIERIIGYKFER